MLIMMMAVVILDAVASNANDVYDRDLHDGCQHLHHVFFEFTLPYVFKQYVMWIILAQLLENAIITMLIGKLSESCQLLRNSSSVKLTRSLNML